MQGDFQPDRSGSPRGSVVAVEHWPSETPLLVLVSLVAAGLWLLFAFSIIGIVYALLLGVFFFLAHVSFIAHIRGSAVRLSADQFPELHERVVELSARAGLATPPDAYLVQAGGALNALATKFLRSHLLVLFTDLLDACGDDAAARDMIIGHEIGHVRAGHLRWFWLIAPGLMVPFLGTAYMRARELTCDRYGAALCGDPRGALLGLAILAAGGRRAGQMNLTAWVSQRKDLDTGWMTLGRWLAAYPPLCDRASALNPSLLPPQLAASARGPLRALGILSVAALIPIAGGLALVWKVAPVFKEAVERAAAEQAAAGAQQASTGGSPRTVPRVEDTPAAREHVKTELDSLAGLVEEVRNKTGAVPADVDAVYAAWGLFRRGQPEPLDPFDGSQYGYAQEDDQYVLWSSGPDGKSNTADDIEVRSGADPRDARGGLP